MEYWKSLSSLNPTATIFIPEYKFFQGYDQSREIELSQGAFSWNPAAPSFEPKAQKTSSQNPTCNPPVNRIDPPSYDLDIDDIRKSDQKIRKYMGSNAEAVYRYAKILRHIFPDIINAGIIVEGMLLESISQPVKIFPEMISNVSTILSPEAMVDVKCLQHQLQEINEVLKKKKKKL